MSAPAGPGRRAAAAALDAVVVFALLCAGTAVVMRADRSLPQRWVMATLAAWSVLPLGYLAAEAVTGRTLGKRWVRLKVGARDGGAAGPAARWGRWALKASPVAVATAAVIAEIAAEAYPISQMLLPYVDILERLAAPIGGIRGAAGPFILVVVVYGGGIPLAVLLVLSWLPALGPSRRALHDRLTRTSVHFHPVAEPTGRAFEPLLPAPKPPGA